MWRLSMNDRQYLFQGIIYMLGFFLFWEWLRPLEKLTDTKDISIFIIYAAFCFFISFLQLKWWLSIPIKFLGFAWVLHGLYFEETFLSKLWFIEFYHRIEANLTVMLANEWWKMTPFFRSLLFLLLLWLMSYLLYYWFIIAQRNLFFIGLTFIYITILDTFTPYDGKLPIVRTFFISMLVLGLTSLIRELRKESILKPEQQKWRYLWVLPLILVIVASSIVGYTAPKPDPIWPDPVPFIKSAAENVGKGGKVVQKVGYGNNDSRLGGSFLQDDTPVFQAASKEKQYWRIESKDFYTGKGWVNSIDYPIEREVDGNIDYFSNTVETKERKSVISFKNDLMPKLVYPYGTNKVQTPEEVNFYLNKMTGEIKTTTPAGEPYELNSYQIDFNQPVYYIDELREVNGKDPDAIKSIYTQLPKNFPDRIKGLAEEIIKNDTNRYDQVKDIERYFSRNNYHYDTKDIPVPAPDQDYVDQFLFDTQKGYCDNFSSSMVVMLRSVGIPARWVKGFSYGDRLNQTIEKDGERYQVYQITNANAHSWVEAYFPEVGWIPFEPTKGFYNPMEFYAEKAKDGSEPSTPIDPNLETGLNDFKKKPLSMDDQNINPGDLDSRSSHVSIGKILIWIVGGLLILLIGFYIYRNRYRWLSGILIRRYSKGHDVNTYQAAYQYLLKVLAYKGMGRRDDQTLREYAHQIDRQFQSNEMSILTYHYERILYSQDTDSKQWAKVTELWENLINKALS